MKPKPNGNGNGHANDRAVKPREATASNPSSVSSSVLDNAIDYLLQAASRSKGATSHDWKYAILHLVAGIELVVKARLIREHWSLVFDKVDNASPVALASGNFVSVTFDVAVTRLAGIAGVVIEKSEHQQLKMLQTHRNRIQHFTLDVTRDQANATLAAGFSFFLDFVRAELNADLDDSRSKAVSAVAERLDAFQEFVDHRTKKIAIVLKAAKTVVNCPRCSQDALMLGNGDPRCAFCGYTTDPVDLIFDNGWVDVLGQCPTCHDMICIDCGSWVCTRCG